MPCKLCGDICCCFLKPASGNLPGFTAVEVCAPPTLLAALAPEITQINPPISPASPEPDPPNVGLALPDQDDSSAWRREIAVRVERYHSRRKPRPPRYPSLSLRFEQNTSPVVENPVPAENLRTMQATPPSSALALVFEPIVRDPLAVHEPLPSAVPGDDAQRVAPSAPLTAKIIEFPRSWTPAPAPLDELAEPVVIRPRILEAPEIVLPPPALGGITIEPARPPALEKRPGIDIPLQAAALGRRILSAMVDGVIIAAACMLFAFIFWKLTLIHPPRAQIFSFLAGLAGLSWAAYQYLLVIYAGTTPGLRAAGLSITRFDGSTAGRRLRRWRVLASFLSALSLGMGYSWVLLDEDSLCWHDRITHTYLARNSMAHGGNG
jgi:uncharacterized RDD family membrane protein YckC